MPSKDLSVRFSDETYASRSDVAKALGTNLIDTIWNQIVIYRRQFNCVIGLYDVTKAQFNVCLTDIVDSKSLELVNKFDNVKDAVSNLTTSKIGFETLSNDMYKSVLRHVAKSKNIIVNDIALDNIIKGENTNLLYAPLVNYFNALSYLKNNLSKEIDENYIADLLVILNGGNELLSFYRTVELTSSSQRALINREYMGAPVTRIEDMMNNLFDFINKDTVNLAIKLASVYFMINYIKPFENYNTDIAMLLVKALLVRDGCGLSGLLIPLEAVMNDTFDLLSNDMREAQRIHDLTYYVNDVVTVFDKSCLYLLDRCVQVSRDEADKSLYDKEESPNDYVMESVSLVPPTEEEKPVAAKVVEIQQPKVVTKPRDVTPIVTSKPIVNVNDYQDLDEKALRRAAQDLMESDPTLRKSQAHFYVRHCTPGKYYTIQQFKKAEGCVYETARTSMDHLAKRGYYRREQVKNKFVYTPISK